MIKITLDKVMFEAGKMKVTELERQSGVNKNTLYKLYNSKLKEIDLTVLDRVCKALNCQPGDILQYVSEEADEGVFKNIKKNDKG